MGIIQRQGLKHTIVSYAGVGIGLLSTLFIYPRVTEIYGLFQLLFGSAALCVSFFSLGFSIQAVKFFPNFKNEENNHNGFLGYLLLGGLVGFVLFLILLPFVKWLLLDVLFEGKENRELFSRYFYYIIPLVFLLIMNSIFLKFTSNFHRIVVPNILEQLLIKITLPILTLLVIGSYISTNSFVQGVILNYILVFVGLVLYLKFLGQLHLQPKLQFITKARAKEMSEYSLFGLLNSLGSQLAFRIDTLMVAGMINISSGGVYAIVNVISDVIMKPARGIIAISSPIISKSWAINDLEEIQMIYKKSSTILLIIGCFVFLGIWGSIDDLITVMPNSETIRPGKYVILFLGLAKLFDLSTSVNSEIISYSKAFRFNFYALLILAVLNVIFNLIFIPQYQIVGAAMATFCSIALFNLVKLIFIWIKFKMQPFSKSTLQILTIVGLNWAIIFFLPLNFNPIVNILLRSILLTLIYGSLILYFRVSPDVNDMTTNGWKKIKSLINT